MGTDGKLQLEFDIPIRTGRGQNNREHHFARARRVNAERQVVFLATLGAVRSVLATMRGASLPPCTITVTRVAPGNGLDGHDNLSGSCKAVVDELASILGVDPHPAGDRA